ncbi:uncharacterized protein E5676_scaffold758G00130 [Cucumis melo var. makuwa]|uniref:Uncharacterized protein n=1 Tax=Cucumis melo var. makuwa TaxID=1194695 RepID=A0A5D3C1J9_CUCMM|nr:uncharacterized protein E5676_scaffold758G00130 [Cucumis melo var. makuwa]
MNDFEMIDLTQATSDVFKNGVPEKMQTLEASRSITRHEGKIEDVLVKVDKFLLSADFVILDYKANREDINYILKEVNVVSGAKKFEPLDL